MNYVVVMLLAAAACPDHCQECERDDGGSIRCKYDECELSYVYRVADGTCQRQSPSHIALITQSQFSSPICIGYSFNFKVL